MPHQVVQKSIELPKAAADVAEGLQKFISAVAVSLKDGWQIGSDLPVLMTAAITDLAGPLSELQQLGVETQEDALGVAQAMANAGFQIAKSFKKA